MQRPVVHQVQPGCGSGDDACQWFDVQRGPLRHVLLELSGIHDSHYIGLNRVRLFGPTRELPYCVATADGTADKAGEAACVAVNGGWWAQGGGDHSLVLELEEEEVVASVGLWMANAGATTKEIKICDARTRFPELCRERDVICPPAPTFNICAEPTAVHKIAPGCGRNESQCQPFAVQCQEPVRHVVLNFTGVHGTYYIGINRLRLYGPDGEHSYKVVVADGSTDTSGADCLAGEGNWWAPIDGEHSLLLELERPALVTSVALWCANGEATPKEMRVMLSMDWLEPLMAALEGVASGIRLPPKAQHLVADYSAMLLGLAQTHERLRAALLGPIFAGKAPKFPIEEKDALSRLQAKVFCDIFQAPDPPAECQRRGTPGHEWQEFPALGELPAVRDIEICVISQLLRQGQEHDDEWLGTRLYVPPGGTIRVRAEGPVDGWHLRLDAHTDDISRLDVWKRWPRVSLKRQLVPGGETRLFTPFGGLLYCVRSSSASKALTLQCSGHAVLQPLVSRAEGIDEAGVKACNGGWIDCEGRHVILTLPVRVVREALSLGADVVAAMKFYDDLWETYHRLSPWRDARRQRIVPDVQISHGFMHAGYPIMTHFGETLETSAEHPIPRILDVERLRSEGNWGLFHEMGHNMQREAWTFEGTVEVTVNLFTLWGLNQMSEDCIYDHLEAPLEFFSAGCPRSKWNDDPFLALKTYAQILATFGWEPLQQVFQAYAQEGKGVKRDYQRQIRDFVHRWSLACGKDLRPHWRQWGFSDVLAADDAVLSSLEPWTFN